MKPNTQRALNGTSSTIIVLALALTVPWLTGCSTTGYKKSDVAAGSLQRASTDLQAQGRDLQVTLSALNDLVNKPTGDLRSQFLLFSKSLDRLLASSDQSSATGRYVRAKGAGYFAAWERQLTTITNSDVRSRSQARKKEVGDQFDAAEVRYREAQTILKPLLVYLQDIRKALSVDLTTDGLNGVKDIVENANLAAGNVQTALKKAGTDVGALASRMSFYAPDGGS